MLYRLAIGCACVRAIQPSSVLHSSLSSFFPKQQALSLNSPTPRLWNRTMGVATFAFGGKIERTAIIRHGDMAYKHRIEGIACQSSYFFLFFLLVSCL